MRVFSIYDQTSVANTALDTGILAYPSSADPAFSLPDALVAVYEPAGGTPGAGNISIIDNDFGVNAPQVVAMPADTTPHTFMIGFSSMPTPVGRAIGASLGYVPKNCKIQVPAAGIGVTIHLKVYAVFYR